MEERYGAPVERGKVTAAEDGRYTVESYDRPGLTSLPAGLTGIGSYAENDCVYFVLYPDGKGIILGSL